MPNNCLSVLYKHIIQVANKYVGLKVAPPTNIQLPPPPPLPTPVIYYIYIYIYIYNNYYYYYFIVGETFQMRWLTNFWWKNRQWTKRHVDEFLFPRYEMFQAEHFETSGNLRLTTPYC